MKTFKYSYFLAVIAVIPLLAGCVKDSFDGEPMGDAGTTFVSFAEGPESIVYLTPFTDVRNIDVFKITKNAHASSTLKTATTVSIKAAPEVIEAYNEDNDETYEFMPADIYTVANPAFSSIGSGFNVDFKPGEFEQIYTIALDGSKFDLEKKYAVAYIITESGGFPASHLKDTIFTIVSAKNVYDGIYEVDGTCVDANGLYQGDYPRSFSLTTSSPTTANVYDLDYDFDFYVVVSIETGGAANTGVGLSFTFDPESNELVSITDPFNPSRQFTDVSGQFNPGDRSIEVQWTSGRWTVSETWTFSEER
ncbi:MAG TPA: DUF1735 domain-containing protein [Parapedobacter sp.]|uniref:DUF1735 domain-containing protein n=1 Tax=Parapedobacter sp. TaxID=1958893 RepID=UPI002BF00242|nr:DUF1735 domain-containing protein [Parapedobacter sp.]HWK59615.1 DUF1735 domain-containing protein [Parapedobacter sp.]